MKIKYLKLNEDARLPEYKTTGSSGADLYVRLSAMGEVLNPGQIKAFSTGIAIEIPRGFEAQIRTRSGMALQGIIVLNSPGTIDSDFRGELKVILANVSRESFRFFNGDRVAQLVVAKVERIDWSDSEFTTTKRGRKGLGSTGIKE